MSLTSFFIQSNTPDILWPFCKRTIGCLLHGLLAATTAILLPVNSFSQPRIDGFSPANGPAGTQVTITGQNFNLTPAANQVRFGAVKAEVISGNANQLVVQAPLGSSYQPFSITQNGLSGYSRLPFVLTHPSTGFEFVNNRFGLQVRIPGLRSSYPPKMHDITGDGKPDLIFLDHLGGTIRIWENLTTGKTPAFQQIYQTNWSGEAEIFAVEDLNGDGRPEMVVVNYTSSQIFVFRNISSGGTTSFSPPVVITPSAGTFAITITDINGDGKPDIVNANSANLQKSITVYRNTGTGNELQFTEAGMFGDFSGSFNICHADFDGDGKVDIAVGTLGARNGAFLRNTSTTDIISFTFFGDFLTMGGPQAYSPVVGDFNQDGRPDVAFSGQGAVRIMQNNSTPGNFSFTQQPFLQNGGLAYFAGVADLNGDGISDLVTLDRNSASAQLSLYGASPGSFSGFLPRATYLLDNFSAGLVLGDVNLDGKTDIWVTNSNIGQFSFILNGVSPIEITSFTPTSGAKGDTIRIKGTGFSSGIQSLKFGGVPAATFAVQNDSSMYGIVDTGATGAVSLESNSGVSQLAGFTFLPAPVITSVSPLDAPPGEWITITGSYLTPVDSIIIGGRKVQEIEQLSSSEIRARVPLFFFGGAVEIFNPVGSFAFPGFYNGHTLSNIEPLKALPGEEITITGSGFSSTPQDNKVLFGTIAANVKSSTNSQLKVEVPKGAIHAPVQVVLNGLSVQFPKDFNPVFEGADVAINAGTFMARKDLPVGKKTRFVKAADLNGDGLVEAIFYFWDDKTITIFQNKTDGDSLVFEQVSSPLLPDLVTEFTVGDLNNDARPDIVLISGNWLIILKNTSTNGQVSFEQVYQGATPGESVKIADLDKDGMPDLVATGIAKDLSFLRNLLKDDNWAFDRIGLGVIGFDQGHWLEVADLDLDGLPDLILTDFAGVKIWLNQSSPGVLKFDMTTQVTAPNIGINTLQIRDFNGDALPDILISSDTWDFDAFIYLNESVPGTILFDDIMQVGPVFPAISSVVADFNGDGRGDVAGVWGEEPGRLGVLDFGDAGGGLDRYINFQSATSFRPFSVAAADFNHDGRPDIVSAGIGERVNFYLNNTNRIQPSTLQICPGSSITLLSSIESGPVQWQMSLDSGINFIPVPDDGKHSGMNEQVLKIGDIPSSWYGRVYRSVSGGVIGKSFTLQFRNIWQGDSVGFWGNTANWSCAAVPDENTDVIIQNGRVDIGLFPKAVCRTLTLTEGSIVTLSQGASLEIKR